MLLLLVIYEPRRADCWKPLAADDDAMYDEYVEVDLSTPVPLAAQPHSPDNVVPVSEIAGTPLQQVCIGSCTNSSVVDLETVAAILRGKTVHPNVSLTISPGSKQVLTMIAQSGALAALVAAGARVLESGCGPCIGMGQAPASGTNSLRSFNRNFLGRSGTADAGVFLASAEVCAASAITGVITDPRTLGAVPHPIIPDSFLTDDNLVVPPLPDGSHIRVVRGPNIKPLPTRGPLDDPITGEILLVTGDNVSTDDIMIRGRGITLAFNIPL